MDENGSTVLDIVLVEGLFIVIQLSKRTVADLVEGNLGTGMALLSSA